MILESGESRGVSEVRDIVTHTVRKSVLTKSDNECGVSLIMLNTQKHISKCK